MTMDNILFECAALGLDALLLGILYRFYRKKREDEKSLKGAACYDIDNKLYDTVKKSGGVIPYAIVRGTVKATTNSLRSQYLPHVRGVIREKVTKERKVKWSPVLRVWSTVEQDIQRSHNSVPFALVGSGHLFKSKISVEDPLSAEELELPTLYDQFYSNEGNLKDAFVGWFQGERTTGIHEIENMLTEDTVLTGVGELTAENELLKLKPPTSGSIFYLTPLTPDSLIKKLQDDARFLKIVLVLLGLVGGFSLTVVILRRYRARKRRLERETMKKLQQEASLQRRIVDPHRNNGESRMPLCVVCLTNPVEVVILECGHTCLCLVCSQMVYENCPVCRSPIERIVPAFLP